MGDKFNIKLQRSGIDIQLGVQPPQTFELGLAPGKAGTTNYNSLINKPRLNDITIQGNMTLADLHIVSENTAEGWAETPMYVPKAGEICLYTDTNMIKIGDGSVCLIDLPFITSDEVSELREALEQHIEDTSIHITPEERTYWNSKLNYDITGEELILSNM